MLRALIRPRPFAVRAISLNRPSPLPLPPDDQREFQDLVRNANAAPDDPQSQTMPQAQPSEHVNPTTGEHGGPVHEPVRRSAADPGGDWSFKGRVSDF